MERNSKRHSDLLRQAETLRQDTRKLVNERKLYRKTSQELILQSQKLIQHIDRQITALGPLLPKK